MQNGVNPSPWAMYENQWMRLPAEAGMGAGSLDFHLPSHKLEDQAVALRCLALPCLAFLSLVYFLTGCS